MREIATAGGVHLGVPLGLLLADHAQRLVLRRERRHALAEEGVGVSVRKRAHLLRVLQPERRDRAQVLAMKDMETSDLCEAWHELLGQEALRKAGGGAGCQDGLGESMLLCEAWQSQ